MFSFFLLQPYGISWTLQFGPLLDILGCAARVFWWVVILEQLKTKIYYFSLSLSLHRLGVHMVVWFPLEGLHNYPSVLLPFVYYKILAQKMLAAVIFKVVVNCWRKARYLLLFLFNTHIHKMYVCICFPFIFHVFCYLRISNLRFKLTHAIKNISFAF